jgi:putative phosphoribosyl transferase
MKDRSPFIDRRDAGRKLAQRLARFAGADPVILALPRGGVPVAFEVAQALNAPLDLVMVRKIGAPDNEELGIGAVVDGADPQVVLDQEGLQIVRPPPGYVDAAISRQLEEIGRRRNAYLPGRTPISVTDRVVIVVDDGVATGNTALAALRALGRVRPKTLILAVPVIAADRLSVFASEADEVVAVQAPGRLRSVGEHYLDFAQTTDQEVLRLLEASAHTIARGITA